VQVKEPMKVNGLTEVNFKHGGGQKDLCLLRSQTYPLLSHFRNHGTNVECSTVDFSGCNSMLLELKSGGRKEC